MSEIEYHVAEDIDPAELRAFYDRQHHETTRSAEKLARMMEQSFCFVTARRGGELIGIARGVTDGVRGYLAECKLDPCCQGPGAVTHTDGRIEHDQHGIAKEMAYGTEVDFCEELGFKRCSGVVALHLDARSSLAVAPAVTH